MHWVVVTLGVLLGFLYWDNGRIRDDLALERAENAGLRATLEFRDQIDGIKEQASLDLQEFMVNTNTQILKDGVNALRQTERFVFDANLDPFVGGDVLRDSRLERLCAYQPSDLSCARLTGSAGSGFTIPNPNSGRAGPAVDPGGGRAE